MALIELQAARKINAMLREIREEAEAMAATDIDGPPRAKACA